MEKLTELLQQIADKLGVTVLYLWPKVVLLVWTQALLDLITSITFLVVGSVGFLRTLNGITSRSSSSDIVKIVSFGIILLIGVLSTLGWSNWIGTLVSPEGALVWRALRK